MDNPGSLPVEIKPRIGMLFESENDAYEFYNRYGGAVGFSIRRDYAHKHNDDPNIIMQRRFVCNKQGFKKKDKRDKETKKPRAETRTDCQARMNIGRLTNGLYECRDFVEEHNHLLHTIGTTHLMRSQRKISDVHGFQIDLADDSGIKPKAAYDYLGMQVGGIENIGYTRQDLKNYLRDKRKRALSYGDAGSLLKYFEEQTRLNPSFTYSMQLDSEEQITNIFWADPKMIIDYAIFGDVVIFDTTFCTNKELRPFGLFIGFNHHRAMTIFGAALLYDETIESFMWLFETFVQSNWGKKPLTIFTDQDAAMARAISEVLPETKHALCTWHLMQNGMKHLGNLMKDGSTFLSDLNKCIFEYEDEIEFEDAWKKLLDDYIVENTGWLDRIYGIKNKWARCYMKYSFTFGIRSTQLSESINSDLKDHLSCKLDLIRFFKHFERVVEDKRANELKADFDARDKLPRNMGSKAPILKQAGKIYTPYIYDEFLEEHNWILACSLKSRYEDELLCEYVVTSVDDDGVLMGGEYRVLYNPSQQLIQCSCRKFETCGILCRHALKILDHLDIKCIPDKYILRRWTRTAKNTIAEDSRGKQVVADIRPDCTKRFTFLGPWYVRLLAQASNSPEGFDVAVDIGKLLCKKLADLSNVCPTTEEPVSAPPPIVNTSLALKKKDGKKGGKRHKTWVEKQPKKRTKDKRGKTQELGSMPSIVTPSQSFMSLLMGIPASQTSSTTPSRHVHHDLSRN